MLQKPVSDQELSDLNEGSGLIVARFERFRLVVACLVAIALAFSYFGRLTTVYERRQISDLGTLSQSQLPLWLVVLLGVIMALMTVVAGNGLWFAARNLPAVWVRDGILYSRHLFGVERVRLDSITDVAAGDFPGQIRVSGDKVISFNALPTKVAPDEIVRRIQTVARATRTA